MRVCGVICEYNPFHKGHALHLSRARALTGADYVVCAMSGALTQRGTFARHDKWTRARAALLNGADLVLELPARFACSPAPDFARGGVGLLSSLGVVTHLSLGCEADALPLLTLASDALLHEPPAFVAALRQGLDAGLSFPRAQALAAQAACGKPGMAKAIGQPNASLALEYLRALPPDIVPAPVEREGGGYLDGALCELASATAVRAALERGDLTGALASVPSPRLISDVEALGDVHAPDALDQALLYRLRQMTQRELSQVPGMDEGLQNRFLSTAKEVVSREELIALVKTKRYTYTRLSRLCSLSLLGVTRELTAAHPAPTYARILGFRREAAPLLRAIKEQSTVPLITKAADYDRSDALFALDLCAQDLWSLGCASPRLRACGRDLTTSPIIV